MSQSNLTLPTRTEAEARAERAKRAYKAAIAADQAWSSELQARFGKRAGDMRYRQEGKGTPELARLHEAKRKADEELQTATSQDDKDREIRERLRDEIRNQGTQLRS